MAHKKDHHHHHDDHHGKHHGHGGSKATHKKVMHHSSHKGSHQGRVHHGNATADHDFSTTKDGAASDTFHEFNEGHGLGGNVFDGGTEYSGPKGPNEHCS
jgi:hypothetical protein